MLKSQDQRAKFLVDILVEYAESIAQGSPRMEYVYDYMNEYMYPKVEYISKVNFKDNEELNELLRWREFVLEMDVESELEENILSSVADTISILYEKAQKESNNSLKKGD